MASQKISSIVNTFVVHPLSKPDDTGNSPGKKPILSGWQKLTKTPDNLQNYIDKGYNLGIVCGKVSNVTVIDFDSFLFSDDIFRDCTVETLESTRTTGRGHVYFQYNSNLSASKHHELGVEIMSDGNNIVIPPSIHPSGDRYSWVDPDIEIAIMPQQIENNLKNLFKIEAELKQIIGKCRACFKSVLKDKKDMHGAEGREYMIAVCTDLKANGANEQHAKMFAKIMYGKDFDEEKTLTEWHNLNEKKTWKCNTLKTKLPAYIDLNECNKCDRRRDISKENSSATCKTCLYGHNDHAPKICKNNSISSRVCICDDTCAHHKPKKIKEQESDQANIKKEIGTAYNESYQDSMSIAKGFQKITPIYFDESRNFWVWLKNIGCYVRADETTILSSIFDHNHCSVWDKQLKSELLECIKITGRTSGVKEVPSTWIHTLSGIVDYTNGENFAASPEYFLSRPIPHKIGVDDKTPMIDMLLKDWVGDDARFLIEWLAYCLVDSYPIHRLLIMFGSGRNGKSQYAELISRFVGVENITATELEKVIDSRFEASKLYRKKVALIGETNFTAIKSSARIKSLTGADIVTGEFKNKDPFDFRNTAKITISTNSVPDSLDKTEAFYSRCIIQEFKNQFDEGVPVINLIPEWEYENLLNRCIKLLPKLVTKGKFTNEGTIQQKAAKYERLSNPFPTFREKEIIESIGDDVPVWVLRERYSLFLKQNGFRNINDMEFGLLLNKEGFEKKRITYGEKKWVCILDYRLKTPWKYISEGGNADTLDTLDTPTQHSPPIGEECSPTLSSVSSVSKTEKTPSSPTTLQLYLHKECGLMNKPDSQQDKSFRINQMVIKLMTDLKLLREQALKIMQDYCIARGW